jgi:hypothetical protein
MVAQVQRTLLGRFGRDGRDGRPASTWTTISSVRLTFDTVLDSQGTYNLGAGTDPNPKRNSDVKSKWLYLHAGGPLDSAVATTITSL